MTGTTETLRELTGQYLALLDLGTSEDPEDRQAFLDTLEGLDFAVGLKADQYADVIAAINTRAGACIAESKRLKIRAEKLKSASETMEERLLESMRAMDKKKIETDLHTFRRCTAGGKQAVEITAPDKVPGNFCHVITEPDKDKIRAALESGENLDFAELKPRGEYLKIN